MTRSASPLDVSPVESNGSAVFAGAGATVVHVALVALAVFVGAHFTREATKAPTVTELFDVELPPEPPAPPEAEAQAAEPAPAPVSRPIRHSAKPTPAEPPAAAQAGPLLTAADDAFDFGEHIVEGAKPGFAGGSTDPNGSSTKAVRHPDARGASSPRIAAPPPEVDRSRAAQLAGGSAWDCPFPSEADDAGVDHALVALRIEVAADGHVLSARAARDPGHGFGREARRCALSKRWTAGLDRAGQPIDSTTVLNVRFDR
ncbi:MAG TPA: hypothetical protein VJV79_08860 [Polyangiaceae bacterium]|nr:hypothetical protein [Polyangiaceae bacterium]